MYITNYSHQIQEKNSGQNAPFLKFWRRDESCKVCGGAVHLSLPPVWIFLIDDMNDVTRLEFQSGFFARDQVIFGRVIVKLCSHIHLRKHYPENITLVKPSQVLHKDDLANQCLPVLVVCFSRVNESRNMSYCVHHVVYINTIQLYNPL